MRKDKDAQIKERYNTEVPKENSNLIRHPSSKYVGIVINKKIEEVI